MLLVKFPRFEVDTGSKSQVKLKLTHLIALGFCTQHPVLNPAQSTWLLHFYVEHQKRNSFGWDLALDWDTASARYNAKFSRAKLAPRRLRCAFNAQKQDWGDPWPPHFICGGKSTGRRMRSPMLQGMCEG